MNWDEYYMRHVYLVASKSKDPRTKIGAVIIKGNNIVSTGYNGFPAGVEDLNGRYNDKNTKLKFIVHAEANAILQCAKLGCSCDKTVMYTNGIPCNECMKSIIQAGISEVVFHERWMNPSITKLKDSTKISMEMADEAKVLITMFCKKLDCKGLNDGVEINV